MTVNYCIFAKTIACPFTRRAAFGVASSCIPDGTARPVPVRLGDIANCAESLSSVQKGFKLLTETIAWDSSR